MRPVDLARAVAVSQQAVRNYEEAGILPPATRLANGYRRYSELHLAALEAFVALVSAIGHGPAREIMVAFNMGETTRALEALDRAHAQLLVDRDAVRMLDDTLGHVHQDPPPSIRYCSLSAGELARRLGVTTTALRGWERAGVLSPMRDKSGHRRYGRQDVHDAELAHLLRRANYRLDQIAAVIRETRAAGGSAEAHRAVRAWAQRINQNSRSLLTASAALSAYLTHQESQR
ncbi:MerR family transcriptional regulator [Prescottella soli]|uniref:MerR family transcriptional regulator n=1 Tax=Prescottella soli TaxID=1543852 RepID=A0ABW9G1C6_9NOCA